MYYLHFSLLTYLESRYAYFKNALSNLDKSPSDFPDAIKKRKRVLEVLEKAPPPPPKVWTKAELQEQALKDRQTQNAVKLKLSGLMDLLKKQYQRFRRPVIVMFTFNFADFRMIKIW